MDSSEGQAQTDLKVTAIVVVAVASLLGVVPPVLRFSAPTDAPSDAAYVLRAFTAGVILALAFVHVIADGQERLNGLAGDFPVAQVMVMGGIVIMFLTERASLDYLAASSPPAVPMERRGLAQDAMSSRQQSMEEGLLEDCARQESSQGPGCCSGGGGCDERGKQSNSHGHTHDDDHDDGHGHGHRGADTAHGIVEVGALPAICREHSHVHEHHRGHVMLGMLELGIIVHSAVIGVAFGAARYRTNTAVGYIVALSFHQLFEGIGVGTCISSVLQQVNDCALFTPFQLQTSISSVLLAFSRARAHVPTTPSALSPCASTGSIPLSSAHDASR